MHKSPNWRWINDKPAIQPFPPSPEPHRIDAPKPSNHPHKAVRDTSTLTNPPVVGFAMRTWTLLIVSALLAGGLAGCLGDSKEDDGKSTGPSEVETPPLTVSGVDSIAAPGETVPLGVLATDVAENETIEQIRWRIPGAVIDDNLSIAPSFDVPGLYRVNVEILTDGGRRIDSSDIVAIGNASAKATISVDNLDIGDQFTLVLPPEAGEATAWAWTFGDGTVSTQAAPVHLYASNKVHKVTGYAMVGDTVYIGNIAVTPSQLAPTWKLSDVGFRGPEPSIGITSDGCMFFVALEKVMRSCDAGESWEQVQDLFSQPSTSDPWLWVDPATDRIFNVQMVSLACTWIAWSDTGGDSWLGNPWNCGPLPVNDHIKLGSGPWRGGDNPGYGTVGQFNPTYPQAVYFCYNKLAGVFCYTSFDGGATFPVGGQIVGLTAAGPGGLHGAITAAPDGTVYVPPRTSTPSVAVSKDNGLTWDVRTLGADVGTPQQRKNAEVATDADSNAYMFWTGGDNRIYMSRSLDGGDTWDEQSTLVTADLGSTVWPAANAGDPGVVAVAYIGTEDSNAGGWNVPEDTRWHLYVTYSQNALDDNPDWVTVRVTDDPVQIGTVCVSSGACRDGNRNLLDFIDLTLDQDGRMYVAFADGCTDREPRTCSSDLYAPPSQSRDALGVAAWMDIGPSLKLEEVGTLEAKAS